MLAPLLYLSLHYLMVTMFNQLHPGWQELLADQKELLDEISLVLASQKEVVPEKPNIMRAFRFPPEHFRVLIVGQDPYPNAVHATGLAFCVPEGTAPLPPTLRNIIKELRDDLGQNFVATGDISNWANQGVMLLNRSLTTRVGQTAAHFDIGWDIFTSRAIQVLQEVHKGKLVAILWGQRAGELAGDLSLSKVLKSPHPSPLSSYRGFFGSKPFSSCNKLLTESGLPPIDWSC
jgi:uracil-DNA glycosylase